MNEIIQTDRLSKKFASFQAVNEISINVKRGEIYGFLGLNGAGKTTTIRMLLGMIHPTSGEAFMCGKKIDAGNHKLWGKVGYLVEVPYSYPELTVRENLEVVRRLRRIPDRNSVDIIMDKLKITAYQSRKAKNLSLGNAQRLGLAKALLHDPEILILDEPTNGLDPAGIVEIRELLDDLALNHGVTIFISSHILGEISKLSTRIGIIHVGRLLQEVNSKELEIHRHKRLLINALNTNAASAKLNEAGFQVYLNEDGILETTNKKAINHPEAVAQIMADAGIPLTMLNTKEEDLEKYFLRTIGIKEGIVNE